MIKAVCFDFGGVYKRHSHGQHTWKDMWKDKQNEIDVRFPYKIFIELQHKLDTGKISLSGYHIELFKRIGKKSSQEEIKKHSKYIMHKSILEPRIGKLVLRLKKKGYAVPLVSNTIKPHAMQHKKKGSYEIFSPVFLSCDVGLSKSDGSIFPFVSKKMGLKPEECLMIDDNPNYLKMARKHRWKTILYRNPRQLEHELKNIKVL